MKWNISHFDLFRHVKSNLKYFQSNTYHITGFLIKCLHFSHDLYRIIILDITVTNVEEFQIIDEDNRNHVCGMKVCAVGLAVSM